MVNGGSSADAEILKDFLTSPHNAGRQRAFVEMCVRLTIGYLRHFKAKGWSLPINQQTGGNPCRDLAMDIAGSLLASRKGSPYIKVFDFFRLRGLTDFGCADASELYDAFKSLLYKFTRQERSNLLDEEDPQKALLKRAFRDVLKADEFLTWNPPGASSECVSAAEFAEDKRHGCPPISPEHLLWLVEKTYLTSRNRREWCRAIFDRLSYLEPVQNFIERYRLMQAVIIVNTKYLDLEGIVPSSLPSAEHALALSAIERARAETLDWAQKAVLDRFITKGRLSGDHAGRLLLACQRFLVDYAHSSDIDPLPVYFREVMPESEHLRYLKHFKHVFETLIHRAREFFEIRARKFL
jgi:hypothetical protein